MRRKIYALCKDLQGRIDRVNIRLDRIENRMDKLDTKIDDVHNEIKSSTNHGQIATIFTLGIAVAVIYSFLR